PLVSVFARIPPPPRPPLLPLHDALPISPAPSTSARRPSSDPKIFFASSTAAEEIDAAPIPTSVSSRTRPPTFSAVWKRRLRIGRSEEHTSELQSRENLVCRLLLEKKKTN